MRKSKSREMAGKLVRERATLWTTPAHVVESAGPGGDTAFLGLISSEAISPFDDYPAFRRQLGFFGNLATLRLPVGLWAGYGRYLVGVCERHLVDENTGAL